MEAALKVGVKHGSSTGIPDVGGGVEKTGNGKSGTRKSMTQMHRQYVSLQSEAAPTDRATTDSDSLSRSCRYSSKGYESDIYSTVHGFNDY